MVCESNFRRSKLYSVILAASSILVASPAPALTFSEGEAGSFRYLLLEGDIVPGDSDRLEYLLFTGKIDSRTVAFNSDGGSLFEGMMLGYSLRFHGFSTYVKPNDRCLSACLFAFIGGEQRYVYPSGLLGGHQFYGGNEKQQSQSVTQFSTAEMFKFAREMGVSAEAIEIAASTAPGDMHVYSPEELKAFAISVPHKPQPFHIREARRMGIKAQTYLKRWRSALTAFQQSCSDMKDATARRYCALRSLWANDLRR